MVALLVALGIDNLGSGLFLPLTLVYATRVVGLPLAVAGVTVTAGTLMGLLVPPVAGRLVDRVGPRPVVIASQVVQALGAFGFAVAGGVGLGGVGRGRRPAERPSPSRWSRWCGQPVSGSVRCLSPGCSPSRRCGLPHRSTRPALSLARWCWVSSCGRRTSA